MKKFFLFFLLLLSALPVKAQVSGAGQLSCSGAVITGTAATSGTANNTVLANISPTPAYAALVQLDQTSTITGGVVTFQLSYDGGANYISVPVAQVLNSSTGAQLTNPYTLVASTNQSFLVILSGASAFQVKLTTAVVGSATVTPYITLLCSPPTLGPLLLDSLGNVLTKINAALPAGAAIIGKVTTDQTTHGTTDLVADDYVKKAGVTVVADPCEVNAKVYDSFSGTVNTQLITGTSAKKIYFCSFSIVVGAATNVAIVEGTGTVCATGVAKFPGLSGGTTAATGWNLSANGGLTYGNGGSSIAGETTNADNVCVLVSAANQTNISYSYVVQ